MLWCRYQVATSRAALGDFAEALAEFESLLALRRARLCPDHADVLELRRQIGVLLASSGDVSGARTHLANLLADAERIHGIDHRRPPTSVNCLPTWNAWTAAARPGTEVCTC